MQPSEAGESPEIAPAAPPIAVAEDVLCTGCGYDLRRLPVDVNCPECGRAIRKSLEGHLLAGADPRWLRRIARGAGLLAWGWMLVAYSPIAFVGLGMFFLFVAFTGRHPAMDVIFGLIFVVFPLAFLLGLILVAGGAFLVTILDPRESLRETTFSTRRLARLGMIGAVVAYLATIPVAALVRITVAGQLALLALAGATLIAITIGIVALLRTLAALVSRVPDQKHADRLQSAAKFFMWMLPIAVLLQLIANVARSLTGATNVPLWDFAPCVLFLLWVVIVVRAAHVSVLLFRSRRMIRLCLTQSQLQSEYDRNSPRRLTSSVAQWNAPPKVE